MSKPAAANRGKGIATDDEEEGDEEGTDSSDELQLVDSGMEESDY